MAKKTTTTTSKKPSRKTNELPHMTGEGVEVVSIPELDELAEAYVRERDKRLKMTPREVAAKSRLLDAMHAHADKLRMPDDTLVYRYDETRITVAPGKEKLRVETMNVADDI